MVQKVKEGADSGALVEAVLVWTGYGSEVRPQRSAARLVERFGSAAASQLLPQIKSLEDEFYQSDARHVARTLPEMGKIAADEFRLKHPNIPLEIVDALAWCYTFDWK